MLSKEELADLRNWYKRQFTPNVKSDGVNYHIEKVSELDYTFALNYISKLFEYIDALQARLEAAEAVCRAFNYFDKRSSPETYTDTTDAYDKWEALQEVQK